MPSTISGTPMVYRAIPEVESNPINPMVSPIPSDANPRNIEAPSTADTVVKDNTRIAKYSAGPNFSASVATIGAKRVSSNVAIVPATKDPIAAVANAGPARPLRAMRLPSNAVTMEDDSPGVLSRIEVVDPPN
ncbi:hypothetical protein D3C76_958690 [compost metagenome]